MGLTETKKAKEGFWAEELAAKWLKKQGLQILERNFQIRGGEIDIIAKDKSNLIIFIEVKQRKNENFANIFETISQKKIKLLRQTAISYLQSDQIACRFDAIFIVGNEKNHQITWLKDIF